MTTKGISVFAAMLFAFCNSISIATANSYPYYCSRCGKAFYSNSPTENFCKYCSGRAKRADWTDGNPNYSSDVRWEGRREAQRANHQKQRELSNTMFGMADRALSRQALRAQITQQAAQSEFQLKDELLRNIGTFPSAVQAAIMNAEQCKVLTTLCNSCGSQQRETYDSIVLLVSKISSGDGQAAIEKFWNFFYNVLERSIALNRSGMTDISVYIQSGTCQAIAAIVMKPLDPQFKEHYSRIESRLNECAPRASQAEIQKARDKFNDFCNSYERRMLGSNNIKPFDPSTLPPGAKQLREELYARYGANPSRQPAQQLSQQPVVQQRVQPCIGNSQGNPDYRITREDLMEMYKEPASIAQQIVPLMTPEAYQQARKAVEDIYRQLIGTLASELPTAVPADQMNRFWSDENWNVDDQALLQRFYFALCAIYILDDNIKSHLKEKFNKYGYVLDNARQQQPILAR